MIEMVNLLLNCVIYDIKYSFLDIGFETEAIKKFGSCYFRTLHRFFKNKIKYI